MKNLKQANIYDVVQEYLNKGKLESYSFEPSIGFPSLTYKAKDGFVLPSEEDLKKEIPALQASIDALQYQRDRAVAYDPIPEQLDQIYHDIDEWKAKIKAVKDKFPKP